MAVARNALGLRTVRGVVELEVVHEGVLDEVVGVHVGGRCDAGDAVELRGERVEPAVVVAVWPEAFCWFGVHLSHRDTAALDSVTSPLGKSPRPASHSSDDLIVGAVVVASLLGHANAAFTLGRYVGVRSDISTTVTAAADDW